MQTKWASGTDLHVLLCQGDAFDDNVREVKGAAAIPAVMEHQDRSGFNCCVRSRARRVWGRLEASPLAQRVERR